MFHAITLFLFLGVMSLSTGCVALHSYQVRPLCREGTQVIVKDGLEVMSSEAVHQVLLSSSKPKIRAKQQAAFALAILNRSDRDLVFKLNTVKAIHRNLDTGVLTQLYVYSRAELISAAESQRELMIETYKMRQSWDQPQHIIVAHTVDGKAVVRRVSDRDCFRMDLAPRIWSSHNIHPIRYQDFQVYYDAVEGLLADEWKAGLIMVSMPAFAQASELMFEVTVGSEVHRFCFAVSE
jgi:hypothetical protein